METNDPVCQLVWIVEIETVVDGRAWHAGFYDRLGGHDDCAYLPESPSSTSRCHCRNRPSHNPMRGGA